MTKATGRPRGRVPLNLLGQRFGKLTVIAKATDVVMPSRTSRRWRVRCDCGVEKIVEQSHLTTGDQTACGCGKQDPLWKESQRQDATRHGHGAPGRQSLTYKSWIAMKTRCNVPGSAGYQWYGGRGITVCERWLVFESFLADMGKRPPGTTLDRFPNGNGNYEPGNARWASHDDQARNRSNTKLTPDLVQEILGRLEHGESQSAVARRMNISSSNINAIWHRRTWRDQ